MTEPGTIRIARQDPQDTLTAADGRAISQATNLSAAEIEAAASQTLHYLKNAAIPHNTRKALEKDIRYFEAWHMACFGKRADFPTGEEVMMVYLGHHLFDPDERKQDPSHGMPLDVEKALLKAKFRHKPGPLAPSTIERHISSLTRIHDEAGIDPNPLKHEKFRRALKNAKMARDTRINPKSKTALVSDHVSDMIKHCPDSLIGARDKAILAYMFSSGGRRRSEICNLKHEDIEPSSFQSPEGKRFGYIIRLGRTKTRKASDDITVPLQGRAAYLLKDWLELSALKTGYVFRSINRHGQLGAMISGKSVNSLVKKYAAMIGVDPSQVSAHGIRAGFLTDAQRQQIAPADAMRLSDHRDIRSVNRYWRSHDADQNPATKMLDESKSDLQPDDQTDPIEQSDHDNQSDHGFPRNTKPPYTP